MCQFIEAMEGLKSSSNLSVANEKFTKFNEYMHIPSKMDENLKSVIVSAQGKTKALVLVCGNSGDGKSHLIANFISSGIIDTSEFEVYIDATSSDRKEKRANEKLREKLDEFSDTNIENSNSYRLIVAINLGVLNDFIKRYEDDYKILEKYISEQGLFDNVPAWKSAQINAYRHETSNSFIGHVDFTAFHRYELSSAGLDTSFFSALLSKILNPNDENSIYLAYKNGCTNCPGHTNCPVFWNYKTLSENNNLQKHVIDILAKAIIKGNLSPSVREINDFFYEIIVGRTFEESAIADKSIKRLKHFYENLTLWLVYEGTEGLFQYTAKEDILRDSSRTCDKDIISLNLKPDFDAWLQECAINNSPVFTQIYNNILFCKNNNAKVYKSNEYELKQSIFKLYIRTKYMNNTSIDEVSLNYLQYLYFYNVGIEGKCKEIIELIEDCVYLWNGRLCDGTGTTIKNGVITNRASSKYYLYKKFEVKFVKNISIQPLDISSKFAYFSSSMRFGFKIKDKTKVITLDIDYELYKFLLDVKAGFVPTNSDRKRNVKYDSFVRMLITESDSDTYVYSRVDNGKSYRISKDDFDGYTFDYEV